MTYLPRLPSELLRQIFAYLPQAYLLALIRTEQRLGQVAVPQLYKSLYFWGTGYTDIEERWFPRSIHGTSHTSSKPPANATRIFDVELLTRSLEESSSLRSYIHELDLIWGGDDLHTKRAGQWVLMDERRLQRFLSLLDSSLLRHLSLTTTDLYAQLPEKVKVRSLQLKYNGEGREYGDNLAKDLDRLHQLSCIPSLESLIIDGWNHWCNLPRALPYSISPNARVSLLSSIQITTSGFPGVNLNEVLSWPKALKVFHFDCWPPDELHSFEYSILSSGDFLQPLECCRGTLEELSIRCLEGNGDAQTDQPINLRGFPNLKRLRIRSDFLLMSDYNRRTRRESADPNPDLIDVLPPTLEQLHLELDGYYKAYDELLLNPDGTRKGPEDRRLPFISRDFYEIMDQLEALAANKTQLFPNLKNVVFGEVPDANNFPTHRAFEESERAVLVRVAFADAGIDLRCRRDEESLLDFTT